MKTDFTAVIATAKAAANAAALRVWDRDGRQDCGTCGGAMVQLDSRAGVTRALVAAGDAYRSGPETYLLTNLPAGIASQNADIPQAYARAFRDALEAQGLGGAVRRFWTYVD